MASKSRTYKKTSCHTSKRAAEKKAKSMRNRGLTAQVRKTKKGACVWSAGKRKPGVIKRTGQRISGRKRR